MEKYYFNMDSEMYPKDTARLNVTFYCCLPTEHTMILCFMHWPEPFWMFGEDKPSVKGNTLYRTLWPQGRLLKSNSKEVLKECFQLFEVTFMSWVSWMESNWIKTERSVRLSSSCLVFSWISLYWYLVLPTKNNAHK